MLAVGCPPPYDAMVREHDGEEFVIFDLVRFNAYKEEGSDLVRLARSLITHESAHVCLHNRHRPTKDDYISKLKYITFDEGFAHFVSFAEDVMSFDFTDVISKYYLKSLCRLKCALDETDAEKRISLLVEANSGGYWDKYAAHKRNAVPGPKQSAYNRTIQRRRGWDVCSNGHYITHPD